ncbi:MAG: thiazole synthase [Rickettsiales bacterium]|nr:thiazole synthase [Rickettsiales bacterium]|tara:strand:- start:2216 stop:2983 length:768 start_codon:yes stop_codon:yes gene_type:complete
MDNLVLAGKSFKNRLILGTGKFSSPEVMKASINAANAEIITVAVRRVDLESASDSFLTVIKPSEYVFLPNTSGARNASEAIRCAQIARTAAQTDFVKLEVTPEQNHLMPDPIETLKAATELVKDGFKVLPYIHADPILAKKCEDVGCSAVMPLGSPIGSNQGLQSKHFIEIIIEQSSIPVIVDAGIGTPSDACIAMEMGADAVMVNTAIATASNPIEMAKAFYQATSAGRKAYLSGLAEKSYQAEASSPLTGFLN